MDHTLSPLLPLGSSLLLGLSGGMDSVVLLHLLQQLSPRYSWRLNALHVHHGLSAQADSWAQFCVAICGEGNIPLQIERVDITPLRTMGLEAAARKLRHAALMRQPMDFVLLAHHLDDQAETLLLQLLRGAGVRGASAMPIIKHKGGMPTVVRPLLSVPRSQLLAYAQHHQLHWIEDESNADDTYPRNFLRHRVLPVLHQRFPSYRATLARSARHFAEASELLNELAQQDAQGVLTDESLDVEKLRMLGVLRGKNLLRYFIAQQGASMPDSTRLEEMLRQLCEARQDARVCITWSGWQMRRYQAHAYILPAMPPPDFSIIWRGEAALHLPPPCGRLSFVSSLGQGVSVAKLRSTVITIRLRKGGENMRPHAGRPKRSLKNLLQEVALPPWQRDTVPLVFGGDDLIYVPEVAIACTYQAQPKEEGMVISWHPKE